MLKCQMKLWREKRMNWTVFYFIGHGVAYRDQYNSTKSKIKKKKSEKILYSFEN